MKIYTTYDGAIKMVNILRSIHNKDLIKVEDIDNILETTEAYKIWLNALGSLISKQEYLLVWNSIINENQYNGKLKGIYKRIALALDNINILEENLAFAKKIDYSEINKLVSEYLPEGTDMKLSLHYIIDGFNGGTIIGMDNYTQCITMLYPNYFSSFGIYGMAHEFHHIGYRFWRSKDKKRKELINRDDSISLAVRLIGSILEEGSAVYFFDNQIDENVKKNVGSELLGIEQYEKVTVAYNQEKLIVADKIVELDSLLRHLIKGNVEVATLRKKVSEYTFMQGVKPSLDKLIGEEMVKTIDEVYGKERVMKCIVNLRVFLNCYNKAAAYLNKTQFSQELIDLWEFIWLKT